MKLIILRSNLKEALSSLERAVSENNNLPVLKNILCKADSRLVLSATNLEVAVTCVANAKITEAGEITIPFTPLYNIVTSSTSERITLHSEGLVLSVSTDNYEAKLQGVSAEEFPIIPKVEDEKQFIEMQSDVLSTALNEVVSAASTSDLKPELNSILFDFQVSNIKLAATDGFRLAEKTVSNRLFTTSYNKGLRALIPLKTVSEVLRIFKGEASIKIFIEPHQILFKTETASLISRVIDGSYPDYTAIIPKQLATTLTILREDFISAVKLVSNFSGKSSDIKVRLSKDKKAIEVYSASQSVGENTYLIPIVQKTGADFTEIAFNWRYLADGVKPIVSEQLVMGIVAENKPALIKPAEDDSLLYIVMPISG